MDVCCICIVSALRSQQPTQRCLPLHQKYHNPNARLFMEIKLYSDPVNDVLIDTDDPTNSSPVPIPYLGSWNLHFSVPLGIGTEIHRCVVHSRYTDIDHLPERS